MAVQVPELETMVMCTCSCVSAEDRSPLLLQRKGAVVGGCGEAVKLFRLLCSGFADLAGIHPEQAS